MKPYNQRLIAERLIQCSVQNSTHANNDLSVKKDLIKARSCKYYSAEEALQEVSKLVFSLLLDSAVSRKSKGCQD